jgi:predicted PurR-regulated permease PerM
MNTDETVPATAYERASYVISGAGLLLVLALHLLPAFVAGFLVYELVHTLAPLLRATRLANVRAKLAAVALLATFVIALLGLVIWGLVALLHSGAGSVPALLQKMAEIIDRTRETLPSGLSEYLPHGMEEVQGSITAWLRAHADQLQLIGRETGRAGAHVVVGMVLGALVSLQEVREAHEYRPLTQALMSRVVRLGEAFRAVVFAQVRIAVLNALLTALYLGVVLPIAGIHLPLVKTMVALTFITGLLPVVGNLISNTVVVVVSLSHSPVTAAASLGFLLVIHKLEYFLNARIVGTQIHARAWEILLAMLFIEAAFGVPGVIAAPIYYAYVKGELSERGIV